LIFRIDEKSEEFGLIKVKVQKPHPVIDAYFSCAKRAPDEPQKKVKIGVICFSEAR
jgi:hypothetical protein